MIRLAFAVIAFACGAHAQPLPPFLQIEAKFDLIDQTGAARTEADFHGQPMLIFFGYANCESICSVALPRMGEALDLLGEEAASVTPIMITIDPANDTPEALAEVLPYFHRDFIGLTGDEDALAKVRERFNVERTELFRAPDGQPVYAHGSFIYLTTAKGRVESVLPPILGAERIVEIVREKLADGSLL